MEASMDEQYGGSDGFDPDEFATSDEYGTEYGADDGYEPNHGQTSSPLADEAMRLMSSVQDWARRNFDSSPDGHTGSDCTWCPLCQFVAVLRGDRPEVTERVAEAGTAVVSAMRAMMEAAAGAANAAATQRPAQPRTSDAPPQPRHAETSRPRVQKITLDDPS
jgi:hypothetical protein